MIKQIYTDSNYIYAAAASQLSIYTVDTNDLCAYIPLEDTVSITGAKDYVYIGTTYSGLKRVNKTCISGSVITPYNLYNCLEDYLTSPYIESNNVNYVNANGNFLGIVSNSGTRVSLIEAIPQGYKSITTITGGGRAEKCHITSYGELYYTISGVAGWEIDVQTNKLNNWEESSYKYLTDDSKLPKNEKINDIYVTEKTSLNKINNVLFVATTSGAFVIDEGTNRVGIYHMR
jgi:hypothetical protein